MNLNKDAESWARVDAKAVTSGSQAQAENVLKMALQDIARLAAHGQWNNWGCRRRYGPKVYRHRN